MIKSENSNKSVVRKALHTNCHDDRPMNISPRTKLVDNKFLVKPPQFKMTRQVISPNPTPKESVLQKPISYSQGPSQEQITCLNPVPPKLPPKMPTLQWTPFTKEDEDSLLIPLQTADLTFPERPLVYDAPIHSPSQDVESIPLVPNHVQLEYPAFPNLVLDLADDELEEPSVPFPPDPIPNECDVLSHPESDMADDELSESNISTDSVILFDGDEEPERPEKLNQHRKPVVGDRISYFDAASSTWINAIITHDLSRRYRHYFNINVKMVVQMVSTLSQIPGGR